MEEHPVMKQELIRDWMSTDIVTIRPETSLPEAHRLMKERRIRRLPGGVRAGAGTGKTAATTTSQQQ